LYETFRTRFGDTVVTQWDERLTTLEAQRSLSRAGLKARDHRERVDSAAAVIMLQNYIDALHPH
jgi:putative Holliday junction resolvase